MVASYALFGNQIMQKRLDTCRAIVDSVDRRLNDSVMEHTLQPRAKRITRRLSSDSDTSTTTPSVDESIFSAQDDKFLEKNVVTRRLLSTDSNTSTRTTCNPILLPSPQSRQVTTSVPGHIQIETPLTTYTISQKCIPCHRCKSMNESLVGIIKPSSNSQNATRPSSATCASNRANLHALRGANKLKDSLQLKRYQSFKNKQLLENILIDGVEPTAATGTAVHEAFFTDSWLLSCVTFSMSTKVFIQLNADLYISVVKTL